MINSALLSGFVSHWLNAVNAHSLHAPFVYDFYVNTLKPDAQLDVFRQIEQHRIRLLSDHSPIRINSPGAPSRISQKRKRKISNIAKRGISQARYSRLLYRIAHRQEAKVIIELGTSLGINTLYLSASSPEATIYTFEGCEETAGVAKDMFEAWDYKNICLVEGNIDDTLPDLLNQIEEVDFAYLDANHRYAPTLSYFQSLLAKAHAKSIFALDDIHWSTAMAKAWKDIVKRPEVSLSLDLFELGIVFFRENQVKQYHHLIY